MDKKAIAIGVAVFTGLYIFHVVIIPLLASMSDKNILAGSLIWMAHQSLGFLTCIIAGIVAGGIAGKSGFKHGFIVGMLGTVLSALLASMMPESPISSFPLGIRVVSWLLVNGAIAGLAGLFAVSFIEKKNRKPEDESKDKGGFAA
ncbi:MAG: hypothetical protein DRQ61_05875 [Gammaproteobacteria bacterium]|nr:MAG: hypothetical protein DRQ61_05875 [Gammaproteobacteria bacterium]